MLTGHGEPIADHVALIDERLRLHERRAEQIHGLIADAPPTAYELASKLWGNIAVTQAYLTLSEVLGHLDVLFETARVRRGGGRGRALHGGLTPMHRGSRRRARSRRSYRTYMRGTSAGRASLDVVPAGRSLRPRAPSTRTVDVFEPIP